MSWMSLNAWKRKYLKKPKKAKGALAAGGSSSDGLRPADEAEKRPRTPRAK